MRRRLILVCFLIGCFAAPVFAADHPGYAPSRAVYDVSSADVGEVGRILDRVSLLQTLYGSDPFDAAIVLVVHEGAIPLFAKSSKDQTLELMRRASSLAMGEIIQFRICAASASMQGFSRRDFPEFVTLVPMADAEIIHLQNEGYAYLR